MKVTDTDHNNNSFTESGEVVPKNNRSPKYKKTLEKMMKFTLTILCVFM